MSKSATTTEDMMEPVTPGEILLEEFILPAGLTQTALARAIGEGDADEDDGDDEA